MYIAPMCVCVCSYYRVCQAPGSVLTLLLSQRCYVLLRVSVSCCSAPVTLQHAN